MTSKLNYMQTVFKISFAAMMVMILAACGSSSMKEANGDLKDKIAQLTKLKKDQEKLNGDIKKLEEEIGKLDSSTLVKPRLVAITPVAAQNFSNFITLKGWLTKKNIIKWNQKGQGGQVKAIYVKQGDHVRKGQLLIKIDDAVMLQNLHQLETQLDYAKDLYTRQKNLWDQGIGTEVQYITAKNNVTNLEKQISVLKEQWNTSNVYAEASGVAETVNIHVGEMFSGLPAATITIVSDTDLKAVVDVPENYLNQVKKGANVVVELPEVNKKFNTSISLISQLINANSRGFLAEAKLPADAGIKPNQLAVIKIQDYAVSNAIVIPLTSLQSDNKGKYVYVEAVENGRKIARKKVVEPGQVYGDNIEIKQGLISGDKLITEGFQSLYDGQVITAG